MKHVKIASIPADGIGPAGDFCRHRGCAGRHGAVYGYAIEFTHFDWGSDYYKSHGQ